MQVGSRSARRRRDPEIAEQLATRDPRGLFAFGSRGHTVRDVVDELPELDDAVTVSIGRAIGEAVEQRAREEAMPGRRANDELLQRSVEHESARAFALVAELRPRCRGEDHDAGAPVTHETVGERVVRYDELLREVTGMTCVEQEEHAPARA